MKLKTNIPALLMATLIFVASNGIAVFEHICNTSQTKTFSFFIKPACEMEKPVPPCCAKIGIKKKKDCCEHKQFFSKLSIEGFVAKKTELKPVEKLTATNFWASNFTSFHASNFNNYLSGLPPPDNLYTIKSSLCPTRAGLQTFRC